MGSAVNRVGRLCPLNSHWIPFFEVNVSCLTAYEGNVRSSFNPYLVVNENRGNHPYVIASCEFQVSDKLWTISWHPAHFPASISSTTSLQRGQLAEKTSTLCGTSSRWLRS